MTPTVVLETIRLQVHPDFNLRGLAVRNTLLRCDRKRAGEGEREGGCIKEGIISLQAHQHMSFPLITIWLLIFVITVSCDR